MFEILPAAALLLLVQPAVQQPVSGNGIEDVAVVVTERAPRFAHEWPKRD
jgi:hypothetical protein